MTLWQKAIQAANADPSKADAFWSLFLNSQVFVPTHSSQGPTGIERRAQEGDSFAPIFVTQDSLRFLPLFESEELLADWAQQEVSFIRMTGAALVESAPVEEDVVWILNLQLEPCKEISPEELRYLKSVIADAEPSAVQIPGGTVMFTGAPAEIPDGLIGTLKQCLVQNMEVASATLGQVLEPESDPKPRLVLVLKMHPGFDDLAPEVFRTVSLALRGLDVTLDMIVDDGEDLAASFAEIPPFYRS